MIVKFKSDNSAHRTDAFYSAQLNSIIAEQFMDKERIYFKQFDIAFNDVCRYI